MEVVCRQKIREAVARALLLDCESGEDDAIEAVAHAFALPVEAIRDALPFVEEQTAC